MAGELYQFPTTTLPELQQYTDVPPQLQGMMTSQLQGGGVNTTMDAGPSTPAPFSVPMQQGRQGDSSQRDRVSTPKDNNSIWPTTLAVLSALSGNFGPAIQLEEQKRKTQLYKYLDPHIRNINALSAKGEYEKAGDLTDQLMMQVGDRAPEVVNYMKEERARIAQKYENFNAFKVATHFLDDRIKEGDIRRPTVDYMKKIQNTPSNINEKVLGLMINKISDPHIQWIKGALRVTDPLTLNTQETAGKEFFEPPKGFAASQIQALIPGLTLDNLQNLMNDKPFELGGQMHESSSALRAVVAAQLSKLQGTQAQLDLAQNAPMSPEQVLQYQQQGIPLTSIATRNIAPGQASQTLAGTLAQQLKVAEAPTIAQLNLDPTLYPKSGLTTLDTQAGDTFGAAHPGMTHAEVMQSGGRYQPITQKDMVERVQPSIIALNNLKRVDQMFDLLGIDDMSSPMERLRPGVRRTIAKYTGYTPNPDDSGALAIEVLANRALEQLGKTGAVGESKMKTLKKLVDGIGAQPANAHAALKELSAATQDELKLYITNNKVQPQFEQGGQSISSKQHESIWGPMASNLGVDPTLVKAILGNEGSGDSSVSRSGAVGRFQVMPSTAAPYLAALSKRDGKQYTEADLLNPTTNAEVGLLHLATLKSNHPTWTPQHMLAAYIGGEGAVNGDGSINTARQEVPTPSGKPGNTVGNYVKTGMERYNNAKPKVTFTPSGGR